MSAEMTGSSVEVWYDKKNDTIFIAKAAPGLEESFTLVQWEFGTDLIMQPIDGLQDVDTVEFLGFL